MLSHSLSSDELGEVSLLRSPPRTQQSQGEIEGEGDALAFSRTTRQRIAIQLLSDPADLSSFNDLLNRVIRSNSTGLQVVQLVADALYHERGSPQETLKGRLISLLCAAPRSNEVVTLAIRCLSVVRDQETQIEYEGLVLAALNYLKSKEIGELLQKEALKFTKRHPYTPNLWITAMRGAAPERLASLTYLQRYGLPAERVLAILKKSVLEGGSFSFTFHYLTNGFFKMVQQQGAGWLSLKVAVVIGGLWAVSSFLANCRKERKENTLSTAHKQQLRRELRRGEG